MTTTWTRKDLMTALRAKGRTVAGLAVEMGVTYPALRYTLRTGKSEAIRLKIAALLQEEPWRLWPECYPPQWRESGPPTR